MIILRATIDQPDGHPFGMFATMGLIMLVGVVAFAVLVAVGNARAKRRGPERTPVYPILEPPGGRTPGEHPESPRR